MAENTAAPHSRYTRMRMASSAKRPLSSFRCRERQPCSRWPGIIRISAPLARRTATSSSSETPFAGVHAPAGGPCPAPLTALLRQHLFHVRAPRCHIVVCLKSDIICSRLTYQHRTCGRKSVHPAKSPRQKLQPHTFIRNTCSPPVVAMQLV